MSYLQLDHAQFAGDSSRNLVIFDIDGCLLDSGERLPHLLEGDRNTYDGLYHTDKVILAGFEVYKLLIRSPLLKCLFITSRQECAYDYTMDQLTSVLDVPEHQIDLLMRPIGNTDSDVVLKPALLEKAGYSLDEVLLVIEDGDAMVEHWRSLGITCWQTQPGSILHPSK